MNLLLCLKLVMVIKMKTYTVEYILICSEGNMKIKQQLTQEDLARLIQRDDVILNNVNKDATYRTSAKKIKNK